MDYQKQFEKDESKVIAIDFDGVIHNHNLGYYDGTIYGELINGSKESIEKIHKMGFDIIIYTCKSHPNRPLVNGKNGTELIWEWLKNKSMDEFVNDVVWGKPHALLYIDDKGYRFENWKDTIGFVESLR